MEPQSIIHLSDLHLPASNALQLDALIKTINNLNPHLILVTGDITRHGTLKEYAAARDFMKQLPYPAMVLAGNHDIPYFDVMLRVFRPLHRMAEFFSHPHFYDHPFYKIAGLNSAAGVQWRLDWSHGSLKVKDVKKIISLLNEDATPMWRIVASHHPIYPDSEDIYRSQTLGREQAFRELVATGVNVFLHGHLHRQRTEIVTVDGKQVLVIGASTALGDRERGQPSGFNSLKIDANAMEITHFLWQNKQYAPANVYVFNRALDEDKTR